MAIHGGLTQNRRLQVVEMLKKEHINVLVATDVAARGLDIRNITHVFNYDAPKNAEEYTHRIGRTARAGESGEAVTLLTQKDYNNFSNVLSDRTIKVAKEVMPSIPIIKFERNSGRGRFGDSRGNDRGQDRGGFGGRRFDGPREGRRSDKFDSPRESGRYNGQLDTADERPRQSHQGRNFTNRQGGFRSRR